ncbi:RNase adapter RapZ [Thalassococcus sp. CAU 1522]|uniref:RNase adapter RapZ n=1 Tax=Thalassococcus arenae TaxID=2851652 RepID=A0ABS6N708_9RHOB|nr:RNase adapter RapZ [Thalassococcus arenae]MBV2359800.1 RNase adapter RapZ [Thalassococcus arenae]
MAHKAAPGQRVVLVTGPSGAGRSSAIDALEDCGYEAIDNIPLSLIPRLIDGPGALGRPLALGIDVRNRDFSARALLDVTDALALDGALTVDLLYLDCAPDVLARRYSETRRRHPLAPAEAPTDGIDRELRLLEDVRARADILIDTTELTVQDLRAELEGWFGRSEGPRMALSLHSFSYKRGLPHGIDMALDCRFLRNPHWQPDLRGLTGLDAPVAAYVAADPRFDGFLDRVRALLDFVLPAHREEGKAHFSVGFGCTGGQHRSVAVTERVARTLAERGWQVSIRHRELDRRGLAAPRPAGGGPETEPGKAPE